MPNISDIDAFQAGNNTADFGIRAANATRNFLCGQFEQYPGAFIPNAADDFLQGIWSGFCANSPSGLPAAPEANFTGGQCPITYKVVLYYTYYFGGGLLYVSGEQAFVTGPISSITADTDTDTLGDCKCWRIEAHDGTGMPETYFGARGGGGPYRIEDFRIDSVTPYPPGPDTCGNPPPQYPPSSIPPGGNVNNISITSASGQSLDFQLTTVLGGNSTVGGITNIAPTLILSPKTGTPSLIGSVPISVDLGGIHFGGSADINSAIALLPTININTQPPLKPSDPDLTPTPQDPTAGKKTGLSNLAYVQIHLTEFPSKGKEEFGTNGSPNVYYTGWFEFLLGGAPLQRQHIWFDGQIFINEFKADGYSYVLTNLSEGFATEYMQTS